MLEWYDFTIYGFLAIYIAAAFFPNADPIVSLLSALAVFGAGFVARPLGAFVLGPLVDTRGRKLVMLLSMMIMAVGSLMIGVAPTYAAAGVVGAAIVVLGRLLQGFSAGGEYGSSAVFLVEWAEGRKRGLYGSFHQIGTYGGLIFGLLFVTILTALVGTDAMAEWVWRVPFLVGAGLALVVLVLRRKLTDTPAFEQMTDSSAPVPSASSSDDLRPSKGFILTLGVVALWAVTAFVTINYMPTYAANFAGIDIQSALWVVCIGGLVTLALIPVAGAMSDRLSRKPFLIGGAIAYLFLPAPLFLLVTSTQSFWGLLLAQVVFAVPTAAIAGVGPSTITELFATKRRGTLVSIGSAISVAVFGGFGAYICTWLIQVTGVVIAPAFYISGVAVLTLAAAIALPDLARRDLRS